MLHRGAAVAAAFDAHAPLIGVLLTGPSGAGKSDLALRLIEDCPYGRTRLISDDYVEVRMQDGGLIAAAAPNIAGLIEARGVGVLKTPPAPPTALRLVFDLTATQERMPRPEWWRADGATLPLYPLRPFEASAPAKIRALARAVFGGQLPESEQE